MYVSGLRIYPIKSTTPIVLDHSEITDIGLKHDRVFAIFDANGQALTARTHPRLLAINTQIKEGNLIIKCGERIVHTVSLHPIKNESIPVHIHRYSAKGVQVDASVDDWFSEYLGLSCRLLRYDATFERRVLPVHGGQKEDRVNFSDQAPILIISEASLGDLNKRLAKPVNMDRFRPNIILSGCTPFEEDQWEQVTIGKQKFRIIQQCERCVFTTIDPVSRLKDPDGEPLKTLATYRLGPKGGILFGVHAVPLNNEIIHLKDTVGILSKTERLIQSKA